MIGTSTLGASRNASGNSHLDLEIRIRGEVGYLYRETCAGLEDAARIGRIRFVASDDRNPWLVQDSVQRRIFVLLDPATEALRKEPEVDSYYGQSQGESLQQQNFVAGPQFTFRKEETRLRPFVYIQSGLQRSSSAGTITHSFNLQFGGGIEIKLRDRVRFQITPAEYNFALESRTPAHSYGVKTAFIWTLWNQN